MDCTKKHFGAYRPNLICTENVGPIDKKLYSKILNFEVIVFGATKLTLKVLEQPKNDSLNKLGTWATFYKTNLCCVIKTREETFEKFWVFFSLR